jgi:alanine racemase
VAVWEPSQIEEVESSARAAGARPASFPIHLEIDSGMSRQGANLDHLTPLLTNFTPESPLKLEGVMTHLFASDESDERTTHAQLDYMRKALHCIEEAGLYPDWLNIGASSALLSGVSGELAELAAQFGMKLMLRPGLALYGVVPRFFPDDGGPIVAAAHAALRPILSWKTSVVSTRTIPAGAVVGYNGTFVASEPMRVALLPVGYADGLFRSLGNRFSLLVRGQHAPLVGRISMDHAVIDVTEIPGVEAGDEVAIIGTQGKETVSAYDHADAAGTIPWEVFTRIGPRVRRIAV